MTDFSVCVSAGAVLMGCLVLFGLTMAKWVMS
jgi:hypothetical protein